MTAQEIISKKQSGKELSKKEILFIINPSVPDYQLTAFLMAVYFQGMTYEETYHLTQGMLESGDKFNTSSIKAFKADKHSTGGVGDKVSIILAPLLACSGVVVPMISGRGLGHSGGTLDKLESIPGFKTILSTLECQKQLSKIGAILIGQSEELVPADKRIYALRDSTSTVKSIPLITASILSKKLAEGIDALVMDIKIGKGAFFKNQQYALKLTDSLIEISGRFNLDISCLLTAMEQPLGNAVGNWLEIKEAADVLKGEGPRDLIEVTLALGAEILVKSKIEKSISSATEVLEGRLKSGEAWEKFLQIVEHQHGDVKFLENTSLYPPSVKHYEVTSERGGFIRSIDALKTGVMAMELGAGRRTIIENIDYKAGIVFQKKAGQKIKRHEKLADVFTDLDFSEEEIRNRMLDAILISEDRVQQESLILGYATHSGLYKWPY